MSPRKNFPPAGKVTAGQQLKAARTISGMTVRELADKIDVSASHLSRIECDVPNTSPSEDLLVRIADVLDIDPDDMLAAFGRVPSDLAEFVAESGDNIRAVRRLMAERSSLRIAS